jgi:two-component system NarL family response regulator
LKSTPAYIESYSRGYLVGYIQNPVLRTIDPSPFLSEPENVFAMRICGQRGARCEYGLAKRSRRFAHWEGRVVNKPGSIRILIADDHAVVREGLTALINRRTDMNVVGEASNGEEAVEQFFRHQPDVALIDLRMPKMSGVDAMKAIRDRFPNARLIVLTTYDADEDISRAFQAGARGYLLKDASVEELLECIRTVQSGGLVIPPDIAAKLSRRANATAGDPPELDVHKLPPNY